jgi:hypothetical protein
MQLEAVSQNYSELCTKYDFNKLNKNKVEFETTELDNIINKLQSNVDNFKIKTRKCGPHDNFNNKTVYLNDDFYNFIVSNKDFFKYTKTLNKEMKLRDLHFMFKYINPYNLKNNTSSSIYEDLQKYSMMNIGQRKKFAIQIINENITIEKKIKIDL